MAYMGNRAKRQQMEEPEDPASEMSEAIRVAERQLRPKANIFPISLYSRDVFVGGFDLAHPYDESYRPGGKLDKSSDFNLLDSFMSHFDLVPLLAAQAPTYDFLNLIRTCKRFYYAATRNLTSLVLECARFRAPTAMRIFSFRLYPALCLPIESKRLGSEGYVSRRLVPGFRFLKFLEWRESVVRDVVRLLAKDGHRLPIGVKRAMTKFWYMLDVPDNRRRIGLITDPKIWTHQDLFFATFFMVKLDLRLQHPTQGKQGHTLRSLILAQRGLWYLRDVLLRQRLRNEAEFHFEWMRTYDRDPSFEPAAQKYIGKSWTASSTFGIPAWRMGADSREFFDPKNENLIPVEELIVRESTRRQLGFERFIEDMILWGYVDDDGNNTDVFLKPDQDEESDWMQKLSAGVGQHVEPLEPPTPGWWARRFLSSDLTPHEAEIKMRLEKYEEAMKERAEAAAESEAQAADVDKIASVSPRDAAMENNEGEATEVHAGGAGNIVGAETARLQLEDMEI